MQTSPVIGLQLMLILMLLSTHKAFATQRTFHKPHSSRLGTFEDFGGLFADASESTASSQSITSYSQPTPDSGGTNNADNDVANNGGANVPSEMGLLSSQLAARTPILLRTLIRTVDNSIKMQKTVPVKSSSIQQVQTNPSQNTLKSSKSFSPDSVVQSNVKTDRGSYTSADYYGQADAMRSLNNPFEHMNVREMVKVYSDVPSAPLPEPEPAPPAKYVSFPPSPPPPIVLRETQQPLPPTIQRVIEHVPVPMEVYHTIERQVPVPVPIVREVTREMPVERIVHLTREVPVPVPVPFPQPVPFAVDRPVFVERIRIPAPNVRTFYGPLPPLPPPPARTTFQVQSSSFPMIMWNKFGSFFRSVTNCCRGNQRSYKR